VKTVHEFSEQIGNLRGAIDTTKEDLEQYQHEYEEAMAYVAAARKRGDENDPSVQTQASIAERRRSSLADVGKLLEQMQAILALLERYYTKSVAYRDDLKDNISFTERKRKTLKIASSAFQKAASILRGDTIGAEFYDAAR
jgi:chromosome segregation ATPase